MHNYQDVIKIFNSCFSETHNTQLVKGDDEPIYLPADEKRSWNALYFAHGFFSSALHECAHWLIAGEQRRTCVDFGYWYVPDGRTQEQQALFQQVEVKPQAMEWILSQATGYRFRISIDNLNGQNSDSSVFKQAVYKQVQQYCTQGISDRASQFRQALCQFYNQPTQLKADDYCIAALD